MVWTSKLISTDHGTSQKGIKESILDYRTPRYGWKWQVQFALAELQIRSRSLIRQQAAQGVTNGIHGSRFQVVEEGECNGA
jgi:hypothetical protein